MLGILCSLLFINKIKQNKVFCFALFCIVLSLLVISQLASLEASIGNSSYGSFEIDFIYKLALLWSNYENACVCFAFLICIFLLYLFLFHKGNSLDLRVNVQIGIYLGFFCFFIITTMYFLQDIFVTFQDLSRGNLTFILKDTLVLYHPLILYCSYAYCVSYSAFYFFSIFNKDINVSNNYKIILKIYILYTFALVLGGIWAYLKLNWGGFWFWDPLEVISLLPWLSIVIMLHVNSLSSFKKKKVKSFNMYHFLFIPFLFMFLKSNFFSSIHSFSLGSNFDYYTINIVLIFLLSSIIYLFVLFKPILKKKKTYFTASFLLTGFLAISFGLTILIPIHLKEITFNSFSYVILIVPSSLIFLFFIENYFSLSIYKTKKTNLFFVILGIFLILIYYFINLSFASILSLITIIILLTLSICFFFYRKKALSSHNLVSLITCLLVLNSASYNNSDIVWKVEDSLQYGMDNHILIHSFTFLESFNKLGELINLRIGELDTDFFFYKIYNFNNFDVNMTSLKVSNFINDIHIYIVKDYFSDIVSIGIKSNMVTPVLMVLGFFYYLYSTYLYSNRSYKNSYH